MSMTSKWLWTNAVRSIGPSMLRTCSFEAVTRVRTPGAIPYFNPASMVCHMACGWLGENRIALSALVLLAECHRFPRRACFTYTVGPLRIRSASYILAWE